MNDNHDPFSAIGMYAALILNRLRNQIELERRQQHQEEGQRETCDNNERDEETAGESKSIDRGLCKRMTPERHQVGLAMEAGRTHVLTT